MRAEKLILSAFRCRCESRGKRPRRLSSFATFDRLSTVGVDDEIDNLDEVREREEAETAAWEAFFEDDK